IFGVRSGMLLKKPEVFEYHATVREMPVSDRPRERLHYYGPEALQTAELLAIILRTGTTKDNVIDRGYLSSRLVRERSPDLAIYCKAWPVRNGDRFPKTVFALDWQRQMLRCPQDVLMPFVPDEV